MKLPGGMDIMGMMKQAKEMQEQMQREMRELRVDSSAGGGIVRVVMSGSKELIELRLDPELSKNGDIEMLQDLLIAAINEASRKVDEAMKGKLSSRLGSLGLPDGLF